MKSNRHLNATQRSSSDASRDGIWGSLDGKMRLVFRQAGHQRRGVFSRAVRALCSIVVLLVISPAGSLRVFGATGVHRPDPRIDYLSIGSRSCAATKVVSSGRLNFRYPTCWSWSNYPFDKFESYILLGVLSNQTVHNPCSTTHSAKGSTTHCGYPLATLRRGGVLVMFNVGSASGSGRHFEVDHHAARESVTRNPSGSLRATDEISVAIDAGAPGNYYELVAFFRGPGDSKNERLLNQMLGSMKLASPTIFVDRMLSNGSRVGSPSTKMLVGPCVTFRSRATND
jgi:hypothetical protein